MRFVPAMAVFVAVLIISTAAGAAPIVGDFDALPENYLLTGSTYAGLTWETGNKGFNNNTGTWKTTPVSSKPFVHSGARNISNTWGCTLIGIGFNQPVNVLGAWFAGQGVQSNWTPKVRIHGYLDGTETTVTDWFTNIDSSVDWFEMNLMNVDRMVIECVAVNNGGGWYGMDDLTYELLTTVPEPNSLLALLPGLSLLPLLRRRH